jgi:hypothetical protein
MAVASTRPTHADKRQINILRPSAVMPTPIKLAWSLHGASIRILN